MLPFCGMHILILHNIRSAENVGSMFRTADAFGVGKIYISGYSPGPVDRFGRAEQKVAKTALGAESTVPWERVDVYECIKKLKAEGVCVVALEQDARSVDLSRYKAPAKLALIVGTEVTGIDAEILALADDVVEIPMQGSKESLNVAVAAGIALFSLTR